MSEKIKNKNLCIIQARMGSTRLPGKVLFEVDGVVLLEYQINRVKLAKKIDKIVVATGDNQENDLIEKLCLKLKIDCFRGSEKDVLDRYYQCSQKYPEYENIIRVTGDCPLIDPKVIDQVIDLFEQGAYDFVSNVEPPTFPDGMDVEIFSRTLLMQAAKNAVLPSQREHLDEYMLHNGQIKRGNVTAASDCSAIRLSVDEIEDFEVITYLIKNSQIDGSFKHYIDLLVKNPDIAKKNMSFMRNNGLEKSLAKDQLLKK